MIKLKNAQQLSEIQKSCDILSGMFAHIRKHVQPGVTTLELDRIAEEFIRNNGAVPAFLGYMNYPSSLCVSINEEVIHGLPSKRTIRAGDIVGLDCGVDLGGFFSDAAISIAVPPVSDATVKLLTVTQECLARAILAIKPGARVHDISRAVFSHAKANGYGVVKPYCGHGVGFAQHEDPQVPNYVSAGPNPRLIPGMVLAIEPMINAGADDIKDLSDGWTVITADKSPSAHFEHTVAVTASGCTVMTRW